MTRYLDLRWKRRPLHTPYNHFTPYDYFIHPTTTPRIEAILVSQPEKIAFQPQRDRNSSRWVRLSDRIAKQVITVGGIGTIFAVMLVVIVLVGSVLPLFQSNSLKPLTSHPLPPNTKALAAGVDEYGEIAWTLDDSSELQFFALRTGNSLGNYRPDAPGKVTSVSVAGNDSSLLLGLEDGRVQPITFELAVTFLRHGDLPSDFSWNDGDSSIIDGAIYRKMSSGLVRRQSVEKVTFHPPVPLFEKPVTAVDWKTPQQASSFDESMTWGWGATDGEELYLAQTENRIDLTTDEIRQSTSHWRVKPTVPSSRKWIGLMVDPRGENLHALDSSGSIVVWKRDKENQLVTTKSHLSLAGSESKVTTAAPLLGRTSFMIGSESGHIEGVAMSAVNSGQELLSIHRFPAGKSPVVSIASSPEGRVIAATFQDGQGGLFYVPTNRRLLTWSNDKSSANSPVFFSSNGGVVGVISPDKIDYWEARIPHPEASWSGFFGRLWYEGYPSPQHVWQSSTGNVEGELKFGFMPLVFGTLKATFYSMLIGAPIALMAAIFGSEFMSRRWRMRFKPAIELMASVPSVVLGFIGALVLAPVLRDHLMACLLTVPVILFLFLFGAHCWLLLPTRAAIRARHWRLPILMVLIPLGILIAIGIAPALEGSLFGGNLTQWLASQHGSGWSGWFSLSVLPVSLAVAWVVSAPLSPWLQSIASGMTQLRFGIFKLGFFLLSVVAVFAICALIATILGWGGLDPRGPILGPYQERNALLVGCILGFAIIPLIYTISEDALQSVPQHLRSASLGCGATTWQTTMRVVVPTAMSGLFSALMIGFGRAVGETMVVLMAAGNTPLMDMNPMNGYRTLSATLATELPEAARGSTHYHGLFLAALLLFCFTLIANTIAEMVRIRFRKRAYQL